MKLKLNFTKLVAERKAELESLSDDELQRRVIQATRRWQAKARRTPGRLDRDEDPLSAALRREVQRRDANERKTTKGGA